MSGDETFPGEGLFALLEGKCKHPNSSSTALTVTNRFSARCDLPDAKFSVRAAST